MRKYTITTPSNSIRLTPDGKGDVAFTVTNISGAPDRAMGKITPQGATKGEWLSVAGESDREFPTGGANQFTVAVSVPPGAPAGSYPFRFDVVSAKKTGEDYDEGPTVKFDVAGSAKPQASRWWIWVAAAVVLIVAAVVIALALRPKPKPVPEPPVATTSATPEETPPPPTTTTAPATALPYGPDTCLQGYVWREAVPGDHVCVTPDVSTQAAQDNALASSRRSPTGGPYGPDTCLQGYVWREAVTGDHVCVPPETREQARSDNAQASQRRVLH